MYTYNYRYIINYQHVYLNYRTPSADVRRRTLNCHSLWMKPKNWYPKLHGWHCTCCLGAVESRDTYIVLSSLQKNWDITSIDT
jgi:hypothetical protein